jgi:hypothetical protein
MLSSLRWQKTVRLHTSSVKRKKDTYPHFRHPRHSCSVSLDEDRFCGLLVRVPGYRSRVLFPALPYFLRSSGSGRGPLSLVNITEELLEWKSSGSGSRKPRLMAAEVRYADHATLSISKKLAPTLPTSGGRAVGIVCLWTEATEFSLITLDEGALAPISEWSVLINNQSV